MSTSQYSMRSGTAVSLIASVMFAGIYFLTPALLPLTGLEVWAIRVVVTIPLIALILTMMRQMRLFTEITQRIKRRPLLILGVAAAGALVSVQLWLFSWAPLNGRALPVALGYFLLPLVLVIVGRFLYKDQLAWWHWLAAGIAAAGVIFEIVRAGGFSWETLLVCLGYPLYFILRRALGTASTGGLLLELILMVPLTIPAIVLAFTHGSAFTENPALWWSAPLLSAIAGIALWLYVLASKLVPISLFGLLSYVEPALLVGAAFLIGERIQPAEFITYGAIWLAVLVLLVGGIAEIVRGKRRPLL